MHHYRLYLKYYVLYIPSSFVRERENERMREVKTVYAPAADRLFGTNTSVAASFAIDPTTGYLFIACFGGFIRVYDPKSKSIVFDSIAQFVLNSEIESLAIYHNELIIGCVNGFVFSYVLQRDSYENLNHLAEKTLHAGSIEIGKVVNICVEDEYHLGISFRRGAICKFLAGGEQLILCHTYNVNKKIKYCATNEYGFAIVYRRRNYEILEIFSRLNHDELILAKTGVLVYKPEEVSALAISNDNLIVVGFYDGSISIFDVEGGLLYKHDANKSPVYSLLIYDNFIYFSCADGKITRLPVPDVIVSQNQPNRQQLRGFVNAI